MMEERTNAAILFKALEEERMKVEKLQKEMQEMGAKSCQSQSAKMSNNQVVDQMFTCRFLR